MSIETVGTLQSYNITLTLDPETMQHFTHKGNGNFILALYFSTMNYPPNNPDAVARCSNFITNPIDGIRKSENNPGDGGHGHFSSSITFSADRNTSGCIFGSITPDVKSISFDLRVHSYSSNLQTYFSSYVGLDSYSPSRIPTMGSEYGNAFVVAQNGPISNVVDGFKGEGTIGGQPVSGFSGSICTK